jgi:DNA helicase HerA-like ATPase
MDNKNNKSKKKTFDINKITTAEINSDSFFNDLKIGKTIVSDRFLNTIDEFWFIINSNMIVNPFDFVSVDNLYKTTTIGIVKELQSSFLSNLGLFSQHTDLDKIEEQDGRRQQQQERKSKSQSYYPQYNYNEKEVVIARVAIMGNTYAKIKGYKDVLSVNFPVGANKIVRFATSDEIMFALGIPEMENPIPVGFIKTTNGLKVPVSLDLSYIVGPDTAHINASGISGNKKTSYLLFLLFSAYQTIKKSQDISLIIFNTKEEDILHIHKIQEKINSQIKEDYKLIDLKVEPFENVTYFLPRGKDGKPNSLYIPKNYKTFSYELKDIYDRLDLLFSEAYDQRYNLSSIIDYISELWPITDSSGKEIQNWTDLGEFKGYPDFIVSHKSSLLRFLGQLQRFRKSPMFIDKKITSFYLGKEIRKIKAGEVFVVDIAKISSLEEQAFIVGDVMKSIDEMYSARHYDFEDDDEINSLNRKTKKFRNKKKPQYILIFIDEINRFIPKTLRERMDVIPEQIMKTVIAGRSRGTVLFSAQQFKSQTDSRFQENIGLHVTAKVGRSELSKEPYSIIDETTKTNIVRLNKGEMVMVHSAFRHPIKIMFPGNIFPR